MDQSPGIQGVARGSGWWVRHIKTEKIHFYNIDKVDLTGFNIKSTKLTLIW